MLAGAYAVLYGANEALQHLEGELAFAVAVVTFTLWGLGRLIGWVSRKARRPKPLAPPLGLHHAAALALVLLLAVPIAISFFPLGIIPFGVGLSAAVVAFRLGARLWAWLGVGSTLVLAPIVAWVIIAARSEAEAARPEPSMAVAGVERLA